MSRGFPAGSDCKEAACNAENLGSIPGLGRSPRQGNGYPLQYPCLENFMDRVMGYSTWGFKVGQAWAIFNFRTFFFQPHFLKKLVQYLISTSIGWLLYTFKRELIRNLDRKMAHLLKQSVPRTKKWTNLHKVYLFSNRKTQHFFDAARLNETTSLLRSNPCSFISNVTYDTGPLLHLCQPADRFVTL